MIHNDTQTVGEETGLDNKPKTAWKKVSEEELQKEPILLLAPKSDRHERVLRYLLKRITYSERKMSQFYDRWTANEFRVQACIDEEEYKNIVERLKNKGQLSDKKLASELKLTVTIPYMYSTLSTIVTYLVHTFAGRKPMFPLASYKTELQQSVPLMESVLQYNCDRTRLIRNLFNFLWDGQLYGVGVLRTGWVNQLRHRTVWKSGQRTRELRTVYEGNDVMAVDPYNFFPDPNVPMSEVNRRGEYVWWRTFEGKHAIKKAEADGLLHWVDHAGQRPVSNDTTNGDSVRNWRAHGENLGEQDREAEGVDYYQVDQGTIEIIPAELGLSNRTWPEKWIFTILNKTQIVQAEPFDADHGMHPVAVAEPYSTGYGFGQLAIADYLAPMQDIMSWLINSHAANVREVLNNSFVVDPGKVEMQDFNKKTPGQPRIIRLKPSASGTDVRAAIQQLQVQDVTQSHLGDMSVFQRLGDVVSGVNDNLRGIETAGSRKTATEVRISGEAGASRLASIAKLISAQALVDLQEQMVLNIQQYMSESFYVEIVGQQGLESAQFVTPDMLVGDFHFPVHDGTLPLDKAAMADTFADITQLIMTDQELRAGYDIMRLVNHLAELAGARGLEGFQIQVQNAMPGQDMPPGMMPAAAAMEGPEGMGGPGMPPMPMPQSGDDAGAMPDFVDQLGGM
jgi:hypothetical protein